MPAVSKQQYKFFKAVEEGAVKKKGLSPDKAKEFTQGVNPSSLPAKSKKKKGKP